MRYHHLLTMLTACAVLAASAAASAQDNVTATATFSRTDVRIVEASTTTLQVRIALPENEDFPSLGSGGEVGLEGPGVRLLATLPPSGPFIWPVSGRITARYGVRTFAQRFHTGLDIAANLRTPIRAAARLPSVTFW